MLTIYKASAGSGKTYTLAYEYIRMLLGVKRPNQDPNTPDTYRLNLAKYDPDKLQYSNKHRAILAITFTNKATDEMKQRIISNLNQLSQIPTSGQTDADYAPKLMQEYGCSRQELALVAHTAMQQILFDYHYFHVSTIDSFFQRVLRTFARELDRQGDFNIELNDDIAIESAVGAMLDDFNAGLNVDKSLDNWILSYMSEKIEDGNQSNFFNRKSKLFEYIVKTLAYMCKEDYKPYADQMESYFKARDEQGKSKIEKLRSYIKKRRLELVEDLKAEAAAIFTGPNGVDINRFYSKSKLAIQALLDGKDKKFPSLSDPAKEGFFSPEGQSIKLKTKAGELTETETQQIKELFKHAFFVHRTLKQIQNSLDTLSLLSFANTYLQKISTEENMLLLSSTNDLLQRIIGNDETPFVYERMGIELHNFLIDEFQDTSRLQWQNLRPLVSNALSERNDSLIIGDVKQSIYRFRNSDSSLLHEEVEEFYSGPQCQTKGDSAGDNTNYRSSRDVVAFNNTLFSILAAEGIDESPKIPGYESVVQIIKNADKKGYVHFIPYTTKIKDNADDVIMMLENMCVNIMRQHSKGKCPWRKIAVLVNRIEDGNAVIDYILSHHPEIPVMSGESLKINKSSAVQLILSFLKMIDRIQSAADPTTTEDKPFPSFAEVSMMLSRFEFFASKGISFSEALKCAINPEMSNVKVDDYATQSLMGGIEAIMQRNPSSLQSLIDTIISMQISPEQRQSQLAYILAFQDCVADFCERNTPSLHSFLRWWSENEDGKTIQGSDDIDAIRVMTIHKSKGLEFECVHVPYASYPLKPPYANRLWIKTPKFEGFPEDLLPPVLLLEVADLKYDPNFKEIAEQEIMLTTTDLMNKVYVAYTRAITELNVYYNPKDGIGKLLTQAFSKGNPDKILPSTEPWLINLSQFYNKETEEFEMGTPIEDIVAETQEKAQPKKPEAPFTRKESLLIDYDVTLRADADLLTTIDEPMELEKDIDDTKDDEQDQGQEYENEDARLRGIYLHDILSQIETADDIDRAVAQVTDFYRLDSNKRNELRQNIANFLSQEDERIERWFGGNSRIVTEQPIYIPSKDIIKRPDRIVIYPDGSVDVVDYKFTSAATKQHLNQITLYVNILRDMGYGPVNGFLWYPLKNMIKCS